MAERVPEALREYQRKRDFNASSEPRPARRKRGAPDQERIFVIQKHDARRLHYDFRLELDGTLKSWAVPKGPSLDPGDKRLAVEVEDHPLDYASFEGAIPKGHYGAGDVIVWDRGTWEPHGDPRRGYAKGKLSFTLHGEKLAGDWHLVRTHLRGSGDKPQWLLMKEDDDYARAAADYAVVEAEPASVISGATVGKKNGATPAPTKRHRARKRGASELPDLLAPQLATLAKEPPPGEWLYEVKYDGYRLLARVRDGEVRLFTRNGNDWTHKLPQQAAAIAALDLDDCWLDGEIVVLNDDGAPDFQALQRAFELQRSGDIIFYLFDAPFFDGRDQREQPLQARREPLRTALAKTKGALRFSDTLPVENFRELLRHACAMQLEGVIAKRANSTYVSRRSPDWIKLKCRQRQEFVIVGYSRPKGSRSGFGALLLAVNDGDSLRYAGRVGTGFDERSLKSLHRQLQQRERASPALASLPKGISMHDVHWVEPELVGEVEFAEWTQDGIVRQAVFIALRSDKPAKEIVREVAATPAKLAKKAAAADTKTSGRGRSRAGKASVAGIAISNPDRVIDADSGATKLDLAAFYEKVGDWILPELRGRPVSLLRAPEGIGGEQFFQKHAVRLAIPHITQLDRALDPKHQPLMQIDSLEALIGAAQMGTVELHTWCATSDRIDRPDRFVLDLDPDPALPWSAMIEAAQLVLTVLDELKLEALLKTSGGKGIHILVPLARHHDWETVKGFAHAITRFMARQLPDRFSAISGPKNRVGKIFIDYLRNGFGASTVAAFSARARPGLPVSVPIHRHELETLTGANQWTIHNLHERLATLGDDPWAGRDRRQRINRGHWKQLDAEAP